MGDACPRGHKRRPEESPRLPGGAAQCHLARSHLLGMAPSVRAVLADTASCAGGPAGCCSRAGLGDGGGRGPLLGSSRELPPTWVSACQAWGRRVGTTDRAERSCWDRWVRRPAGTQGPVLVTGPGSSPGRWPSAPDGFAVTGALLRGRKPEEGCSWPWLSFPDAVLAGRPILQTQLGPGERAAGGSFLPPLNLPLYPVPNVLPRAQLAPIQGPHSPEPLEKHPDPGPRAKGCGC